VIWCMLCFSKVGSFRGILSYCKGYCGWVGCRAECGTSRGSKVFSSLVISKLNITYLAGGGKNKDPPAGMD